MNGKKPFDTHIIVLHVQMNEFPEGHVKVPSWELFILHIAVRFCTAIVFKNTSYHILHAGRKQPFATLVHAESF